MRSILRFDTASAESGLLFQRFAENLTAAILPKAVAKLELRKMATRDPKLPFNDFSELTNQLA